MKTYLAFIVLLLSTVVSAQTTINSYKYVIVPDRFSFSKEDNQYGLNTTAELLLEQKGFTVFGGNATLPQEVAGNRCNALIAEVTQRNGLFSTNLTLLLKDCQGNVVYKSKEGKSREKDFAVAYDLALKDAFASFKDVPYKYDGTVFTQTQITASAVAAAPAVPAAAPVTPAAVPAAVPAAPAPSDFSGTLYAQAIPNGFQIVDTTPKKVMTLLKTSQQDNFIAEAGTANGIVFKRGGEWYFEYYKEGKLVSQKLEIRF